ncbi:hypothetical protein ACLI1A_03755 [Flavobacterium sp. RHBU_3]|uniref:hypothetical protein n=1 Tax=Flavobacterium sp. RHBU_3 TaxID=3391184 RepID=UPI00398512B2
MKRKIAILNLVFMALVQFTIGYKSFHVFSHHVEHKTHTEHSIKGKAIVSADTHEECSVCDFHFDFFIAPQQFCLKLDFPYTHIPYTYNSIEGHASFSGSLFTLRGPPALA